AGHQPRARHAPSRRHRADRGERRGGGHRFGRERPHFDCPRRHHRARPRPARPACPAQGARRAAAHHGGGAVAGESLVAYHPFRHLGLKILAIALAGAIWLTVGDQRAIERTMRAHLEYHNLPGTRELMASPPDTVEVRLRGPSGTIGRLLPGEVVAVLDLTSARPGTRLFHLLGGEGRGAGG